MNLEYIADGLLLGATIGLGAIGLTLTYSILRFANFTQGDLMSWGAYLTLTLAGAIAGALSGEVLPLGPFSFGWPILLASLIAMGLTGLLALLLDQLLFRRLRRHGSAIVMVIASFGASMALRSLLEFIYTPQPLYFTQNLQIARRLGFGVRMTPDQLAVLGLTAILVLGLHLLLTRSHIGRAMRAAAENPALAEITGIDVAQVVRITWLIGGALACAAGVMIGLTVQIRPYMGFDLLLPLFAAAILGGIGSIPGAMLGGLVVGLAESLGVLVVGAEYRAAISFAVLILLLLFRPTGLFGSRD
ncbi:MAG TPA: branched-chain amino acid ABC transporter permease [Dongiaceae bacterium]|jgi:branched-chain amino acid transport system permease protein|nr:branched-chain amino acid ABC transporter permease [Dongiaceae bacterium]